MKKALLFFLLCIGIAAIGCQKAPTAPNLPVVHHTDASKLPVWHPEYRTTFSESYYSGEPEEDELRDVQCPIPMKDRVRNYTGTQCVFSSLECLARWGECKQLLEPEPLTSRPGCRSYSGPSDAAEKLKKFGVKFENSYRDREAGIRLIKKAMADGRGCLWGVPGHAMVLCHYDEEKNVVKFIDNSDRSLRIQTITVERFKERWDSWIMVIYPDPDPFPAKAKGLSLPNLIPIVDRNNSQGKYPKDYIPVPRP